MSKYIYVLSRCITKRNGLMYRFHFIGYLNGKRIKEIFVQGGDFILGEDYLLVLDGVYSRGDTLFGHLVKSKKIF